MLWSRKQKRVKIKKTEATIPAKLLPAGDLIALQHQKIMYTITM